MWTWTEENSLTGNVLQAIDGLIERIDAVLEAEELTDSEADQLNRLRERLEELRNGAPPGPAPSGDGD